MIRSKTILLADDELAVRKAYSGLFGSFGYTVRTARNGREALQSFGASRPDVAILDVMMPVMDGLSACAAMRRLDSLVPILFFTAAPSDETKLAAFGFGADDYLSKSMQPEELMARIGAALRRADAFARRLERREGNLGGFEFDAMRMSLRIGGKDVVLTKSESMLLKLLSGSPGRFFSHEDIISEIRGDGYSCDVRAVRTLVSRLKAKMGDYSNRIVSERNAGYSLAVPGSGR